MSEPLIIQIDAPCHENWQGMTPSAQGKFCASCQKEVIDFSNKTDDELFRFFKDYHSECCIRIETERLETPIAVPRPRFIWNWHRPLLTAALLTSLVVSQTSAQSRPNTQRTTGKKTVQHDDKKRTMGKKAVPPTHTQNPPKKDSAAQLPPKRKPIEKTHGIMLQR